MTFLHFFLLGRDPFSVQLHGLPLTVNQLLSGREFQRRESKSRRRPKVRSRVNQNSANHGLSLLIRDVDCRPSFQGLPIHIHRKSR
jgi:hypothetical protein